MIDQFRTVYRGGTGEIVEKKSRFIATVRLVESEEEALFCLEALRKKYWYFLLAAPGAYPRSTP